MTVEYKNTSKSFGLSVIKIEISFIASRKMFLAKFSPSEKSYFGSEPGDNARAGSGGCPILGEGKLSNFWS